jgi:hypothetical protein
MIEKRKQNVICCFCGKTLDFNKAVKLIIYPKPDYDETQQLFCHRKCILLKVVKSVPLHPDLTVDD